MRGFSVLVSLIEQVEKGKNLLKENLVGVNFEKEGKVKLFYNDKKVVIIDMPLAKKIVDNNNEEKLIVDMQSGCVVKNNVNVTPNIQTNFREIEYLKNINDYKYLINENTNCFDVGSMKSCFKMLKINQNDNLTEQFIKIFENEMNHNEKLVWKFNDMIKDPDRFNLIVDIKECIVNNGGKDALEKIANSLSSDDRFFVYNLITHCKISPEEKKATVIFDEIEKKGLNIKEKVNKDELVELMQKNSNVYLLKYLTPTVEVRLNEKIQTAKNSKLELYKDYLKSNYLILEGSYNDSYDTIKELYDVEKETKLFSSAADRNKKYLGTKLEIFNITGSNGGSVSSGGEIGDPINIRVGEENKDSVINSGAFHPLGIKEKKKYLNHELEHFKMFLIAETIAKSMNESEFGNINYVIDNQLKKYMQEEGTKRYNDALKLLGMDEVEKTKVYYKYDLEDEVSELLLLGHSGYSKKNESDYIADTGVANDFQSEVLKDLYKEVFNNDFRNLNETQAIKFIKKIGFKDTNEIFNKTFMGFINRSKSKYVNKIINDPNNTRVNLLIEKAKQGVTSFYGMSVNDEKTTIKRYMKYKLLCNSIINIATKYGGLSEGAVSNSEMQTYLKDEIKKQYQNIDWSKIESLFNKEDVNEIKKYMDGVQNIYSKKILNNSKLVNSINMVKSGFIDRPLGKAYLPTSFFDEIFNQRAKMEESIKNRYYDMIKNQKYRLMKKFVKNEPHFNKLFIRLNGAISKGETNFKDILKDELKDVYDAHLFFNAMKKDLSKYDNPFEKIKNKEEQKSKYNLLCENQQVLNKMIDEIQVVEADIIDAYSRLGNKNFFELVKVMKKEEMDANELLLQKKQVNNNNIKNAISNRNIKDEKIKLLEELKKDATIGKYFDKLSNETKEYIESYINNQYLSSSTFEKYALERIKKEAMELSKNDNASKKQKMDLKTLTNEKKKVNVQKKVENKKNSAKKGNLVKKNEPPVSAFARRKEYAKNKFGQNNKVTKRK